MRKVLPHRSPKSSVWVKISVIHDLLNQFPRVELVSLDTTPIQELKRFSEALAGPRIFIKRDDDRIGRWRKQNEKARVLDW